MGPAWGCACPGVFYILWVGVFLGGAAVWRQPLKKAPVVGRHVRARLILGKILVGHLAAAGGAPIIAITNIAEGDCGNAHEYQKLVEIDRFVRCAIDIPSMEAFNFCRHMLA